jgi:hypothetical protein
VHHHVFLNCSLGSMPDYSVGSPGSNPTHAYFFSFLKVVFIMALEVIMFVFFSVCIIFIFFLPSCTFKNERRTVGLELWSFTYCQNSVENIRLEQGWRTYGKRAKSGTREDFLATWHWLLSLVLWLYVIIITTKWCCKWLIVLYEPESVRSDFIGLPKQAS